MLSKKKEIHITIISPTDVNKERDIIKEVCDEFNLYLRKKLKIVVHRWEDYPQVFHKDPQAGFNSYHELAKSDLVVAIMWYRLGTFLPKTYQGKVTGTQRVTGTQFEFEEAVHNTKELWIYRKTDDVNLSIDELATVGEQKQRLDLFLEAMELKGEAKHGQHFFKHSDFKVKFQNHLQAWLKKEYNIEVVLAEQIKSIFQEAQVHPNYFVGLYGFLVTVSLMLFMSVSFPVKDIFSETIQWFAWAYVLAILVMSVIGIKALPVELNGFYIDSFRTSMKKILVRGGFMVLFALLFGIYVSLFFIPPLIELLISHPFK